MTILIQSGWFFCGLILLLAGGRLLVAAAVDTARRLRVTPLLIGLTLVAWGTSAPEFALNLISAFKGRGDLALGNVVGANICNMALVLGVCALIQPLHVEERLIRVEVWLNAVILGAVSILGLSLGFNALEFIFILLVFTGYSTWTIASALREPKTTLEPLDDPMLTKAPMTWVVIGSAFVGGLTLLTLGGSFASDAASALALGLGIPAAIVGVTIVSIGTTLPEMVTGVMSVRQGQNDLAVGNAIGSCLFNAGPILAISGLVAPAPVAGGMQVSLIYMGVLAFTLIPICRTFGKTISRIEGGLLLGSYFLFLIYSSITAFTS